MTLPKLNLINPFEGDKKNSTKIIAGKFLICLFAVILILGAGFISYNFFGGEDTTGGKTAETPSGIWTQLKHLVTSEDKTLRGEKEGRINILLLGIGGGTHDGSQLTDTNIILSVDLKKNQAAILSIPRDLYVPLAEQNIWRRINAANALGEFDKKGRGPIIAQKTIENVFDIPIHYYVRVDFAGFEELIDALGGLEIYVENTLDDPQYPIMGKENAEPYESRFERLYIEKGWQKMDGELALKYARSRHALGAEGGDFARAKRQQNVLTAAKDKALSFSTFLNPKKITSVYNTIKDNVSTNLEIWEILKFVDVAKKIDTEKIVRHIIDDSPDNLLYSAVTIDGAFILKPKSGDWSELSYLAQNIFTSTPTSIAINSMETKKPIRLEILNGTKKNGLAGKTSYRLYKYGYETIKIGNAEKQDYTKTIIYDLTDGQEPEALRTLKEELNANIALTLPGWLTTSLSGTGNMLLNSETAQLYKKNINSAADFLIILGQNTIPLIFNEELLNGAIKNGNLATRPMLPNTN
ncbi:MAG: LCP family protein [Patescibacteria group bacterium]|nr:LCP family protein [Patescibacteria group bacterium]MDD5490236.1 LCP family protein [Patescibacteria group bacterium]